MKPPRRKFPPKVYARILERYGYKCACGCKEQITDVRDINWDHRIELWEGGEDVPENLQPLLKRHHMPKTAEGTRRRAKGNRIIARGGMGKRKLNQLDIALAKIAGLNGEKK